MSLFKKGIKYLGKGISKVAKVVKAPIKIVGAVTGAVDRALGGVPGALISQLPVASQLQGIYRGAKVGQKALENIGKATQRGDISQAYRSGQELYKTSKELRPVAENVRQQFRQDKPLAPDIAVLRGTIKPRVMPQPR